MNRTDLSIRYGADCQIKKTFTPEESLSKIFVTAKERIARISSFDPNSNLEGFHGIGFVYTILSKDCICNELRELLDNIGLRDLEEWKLAGETFAAHFTSKIAYFQEVKPTEEYEYYCFNYAIGHYANQLEKLSGLSIKELKLQCTAYGIRYIINRYFESSSFPQNGDLVIYWKENEKVPMHGGVYKGNYRVESQWFSGAIAGPVFQHALFFIPGEWGNTAKFYHPKRELSSISIHPSIFPDDSIFIGSGNGFTYSINEVNNLARQKLRVLKKAENIHKEFPQIEWIEDIECSRSSHNYAFGKVLRTYRSRNLENLHNNEKYLDENFLLVLKPQGGDLVVYSNVNALHYGVRTEDGRIESQWGSHIQSKVNGVFRHPPFLIPSTDANFIRYYRKI